MTILRRPTVTRDGQQARLHPRGVAAPLEAPTYAGVIVALAERGGSIWELISIADAFADVREHSSASTLVDDICASRPSLDITSFRSTAELRAHGLDQLRAATQLLARKAQPEDVEAFARFVRLVAENVARSYPQARETASAAEQDAIDQVTAAVSPGPAG